MNTLEYRSKKRANFATLELTKTIDNVGDRFKVLVKGKDKAGEFYRKCLSALFAYVQNRVPEISDEIYRIDDGLRAGFGWEHGPFQIWDAIGVAAGVELMKADRKRTCCMGYRNVRKRRNFILLCKRGCNLLL